MMGGNEAALSTRIDGSHEEKDKQIINDDIVTQNESCKKH